MRTYELMPVNGQKSFYGKATVTIDVEGNETLYSYRTPIITRQKDGTLKRLYEGWTQTTGRHIKAFCGLNKAAFSKLPIENQSEEGN